MIPDINLLPQRDKRSAGGNWFYIVVGVLFILAFILMSIQYFSATKNLNMLESEEAALKSERAALEEQLASLRELEEDDLELSVQFVESISYPVSPLIIELNRYLADHAYLRNYSFREDRVAFSVDFETITEVSTYIEQLLRSPYVKDVIVNGMSTFDPTTYEQEERFGVLDRYANTFEVLIDLKHLSEVGGER